MFILPQLFSLCVGSQLWHFHLAVESSLCHTDVPLLCSDSSCGPGLSSCSSGPSRCGTWTLEHMGSVAMVLRLTCSMASGIPAP